MSLYQLHRCVYDHLRAGEVGSAGGRAFDVARYDLSDDERTAFEGRDIAGLYQLGLHPVLLNAFCRAAGYGRNEYRRTLESLGTPQEGTGRWQR
jgi:hypothetical protein